MFKFYRVKKLKPNIHSVEARLPEVYKKHVESLKLPPAPVHYIPDPRKYKLDPLRNERIHVENRDIPLKFPTQANEGIWGGEGVIMGFIKEKKRRRKFPNYWVPNLKQTVLYSEILNKYMQVTVTERTLRLIDENYGFDNYILKTPVQDLKSQLALSLRRKMLLALANKEKYHKDEEKNKEVFSKYEKYMIPKEEAEWFGLTLREAIQKQRLIEFEQSLTPVPLKHQLRLKLLEELEKKDELGHEGEGDEATEESSSRSWISRMNPFGKKKD